MREAQGELKFFLSFAIVRCKVTRTLLSLIDKISAIDFESSSEKNFSSTICLSRSLSVLRALSNSRLFSATSTWASGSLWLGAAGSKNSSHSVSCRLSLLRVWSTIALSAMRKSHVENAAFDGL